jgi:putative ABC transport system substrate-binding protein
VSAVRSHLLVRRIGAIALTILAIAVHAGDRPAVAQQVKRIETLWTTTADIAAPYIQAFEEGLAAHGWSAGRNLSIQHHFTDARPEKLDHSAAEIVARKPDLIWAPLNPGALALKKQTSTIPIVIGNAIDPVGVGLVASLNKPGGNVTGVIATGLEAYGKRVELLNQVLPQIRSVGLLYNSDFPGNLTGVEIAERAARDMGLRVVRAEMKAPGEIQPAIARLVAEGAQSVYIISDNLTFLHRQEIADRTMAARLPTISMLREFCEAGTLVCYSSNLKAQFKRSAFMADRVLRGERPGDIPLEQPTHFEFVINMRTAQTLGIQFDRAILSQVHDIIE